MGTDLATTGLHERTDRILACMERAAIDVGLELIAAKEEHPGEFHAWVIRELPFSTDKAYRLMSVARAFASASEEVRAALPRAWTVLFELSRVETEVIETAISEGAITPETTREEALEFKRANLVGGPAPTPVRQPWSQGSEKKPRPYQRTLRADTVAQELLRLPRADLTPRTADRLARWLEGDGDGVEGRGELPGG